MRNVILHWKIQSKKSSTSEINTADAVLTLITISHNNILMTKYDIYDYAAEEQSRVKYTEICCAMCCSWFV